MKLIDAQMNYPWKGVILLGRNPNNPADVMVCVHSETGWVMMDDSIKEYEYDNLKNKIKETSILRTPNNMSGIIKETAIPKVGQSSNAIKRLLEIETFDWTPLRSYVIGEYT